MRRIAILIVALGMASGAQAAERSFPARNGQVWFNMPSGNVGCTYTPKGGTEVYEPEDGGPELACDRIEPSYKRFILGKAGRAKAYDNVGDTGCCDATNIFSYGDSWSKDGYRCVSDRSGLSCTRGKHGFFISRSKTKVY